MNKKNSKARKSQEISSEKLSYQAVVLEGMSDAVISTDIDYKIISCNQRRSAYQTNASL